MHILIIHQAFAALDEAGGTRHYEMAHGLVQQGHRVTIITSPVSYLTGQSRSKKQAWIEREEPEAGICILRTFTYAALHRSFVHRIFSFLSFMLSSLAAGLSVQAVDLVWGTSPPIFQGPTAWLLARIKRVPLLFEVRDLWPAFAIAIGVLRNPILIRASEWLERFLYRHADCVMVNSPGFTSHVAERGAHWIELIPNGVDTHMFATSDQGAVIRKEHGWEGQFVVLYAGAHGLSNDLGIVLQAADTLKYRQDIEFVFVGDGKDKGNLVKKAEEMNLGQVRFLPPVPKAQMPAVLAAADACIAILKPLDLYKTTYPNKVFDYMAAQKPVLLAIDGVIRQVVEDARAGIFVPPGDATGLANAILALVSDPMRAERMGKAGQEYVAEHFERGHFVLQLNELLEKMIKKNG